VVCGARRRAQPGRRRLSAAAAPRPCFELSTLFFYETSKNRMRRWHDRTERGNRVGVDEKQTKANEPLRKRRKNMAWDVLNRILEFARVRKLLNEDLLLGMKPFKDSGQAKDEDYELADEPGDADVMPYDSDQIRRYPAPVVLQQHLQRAMTQLQLG
jgi:hypothetical protein